MAVRSRDGRGSGHDSTAPMFAMPGMQSLASLQAMAVHRGSRSTYGIHAVRALLTRNPARVRQLWLRLGQDARAGGPAATRAGRHVQSAKPRCAPRPARGRRAPPGRRGRDRAARRRSGSPARGGARSHGRAGRCCCSCSTACRTRITSAPACAPPTRPASLRSSCRATARAGLTPSCARWLRARPRPCHCPGRQPCPHAALAEGARLWLVGTDDQA